MEQLNAAQCRQIRHDKGIEVSCKPLSLSFCILSNMSKGITPVIAIILLLLITISMVGFAYVFFSRTVSSSGQQIENQTRQLVQQGSVRFSIEGASGNKIYLRNHGT